MGNNLKRNVLLIWCIAALFLLLAACKQLEANPGGQPGGSAPLPSETALPNPSEDDGIDRDMTAIVVEVYDNGSMLLTEETDGEYRNGLVTLSGDTPAYDKDGSRISMTEIKPGARIEIEFSGAIAESYPAQIVGATKVTLIDAEVSGWEDSDLLEPYREYLEWVENLPKPSDGEGLEISGL